METKEKKPLSFVKDNLKYRVLSIEDKTVEVMTTFYRPSELGDNVLGRKGLIENVEIPSHVFFLNVCYSVISIADNAFEKQADLIYKGELVPIGLEHVTIPYTIRKIGMRAFYRCFALTSINIPANVEIIGDEAFKDCFLSYDPCPEPQAKCFSGLKYVTIEKNDDDIEINGYIGEGAFANCCLLEGISIPGRFKSIGALAFAGCSSCNILESKRKIGGLKNVLFQDGIKSLGASLFVGCDVLQSFNLPHSIEEIDDSLLEYSYNSFEKHFFETTSNGQSLIIPCQIRKITGGRGCGGYSSINGYINTIKIYVDSPDEIEIGGHVFYDRYLLKLKVLPGCVEKYKASKFWGEFKSIEELGPTERLSFVVDGLRFIVLSYSKMTVEVMSSYIPLERYGEKIDDIDFPLEEVVIPDEVDYEGITYKVTKISTHGFVDHADLKSLSISGNVRSIGDYAFYQCNKLESIIIPAGVTDIGEYAFAELGSVSIQMEEKQTDDEDYCTINSHAFENSGRGDLIIPSKVKIICDFAFHKSRFNDIHINGDDVLIDGRAFSS